MHKFLAIALALVLAVPAAAADTQAVAPFLDEQTFAVARLDLAKTDADALLTLLGTTGQTDADEAKDIKQGVARWLEQFRKAGAKEVYLVFSLADVPNVPFGVVPLGAGADAKAITDLLGVRDLGLPARVKVEGTVLAGTHSALERVRALKPARRPELATALAAAGDGAAQLAVIPPPYLARIVEEMMPTLPKEAGGGSSRVLTRGLKWAALGLGAPPKMSLRVTVQSADAGSAQALTDAFGRALKAAAAQKEVRDMLPGFDKTAALLAPKVEGDRVVLSLDDREMRAVLEPLARRAVLAARRAEAMNSLKQLALSLHQYVDAHHTLPPVANFGKGGKPLLSWRVHLLPFLGQQKLYQEFHLDEPWDSEHNKQLIARMPDVYRGPSRRLDEQGKTVFLAPVGMGLAFTGGPAGRNFPKDFQDGTSNTILLVVADDAHAVEWTRPEDLKIDPTSPASGLARQMGVFLVALADGSVRTLNPAVSKETLWAAFTTAGGETLGTDW